MLKKGFMKRPDKTKKITTKYSNQQKKNKQGTTDLFPFHSIIINDSK